MPETSKRCHIPAVVPTFVLIKETKYDKHYYDAQQL